MPELIQNVAPTRTTKKATGALARAHGLELQTGANSTKLGHRRIATSTLYAGGRSLSRLLEHAPIHFCKCGAEGEWLAVLRASDLMSLLEIEAVYNRHIEALKANSENNPENSPESE